MNQLSTVVASKVMPVLAHIAYTISPTSRGPTSSWLPSPLGSVNGGKQDARALGTTSRPRLSLRSTKKLGAGSRFLPAGVAVHLRTAAITTRTRTLRRAQVDKGGLPTVGRGCVSAPDPTHFH